MRLPGLDEVHDDLDRPEDRLADAAGEPDDLAVAVADRRDAVERPLDARPVVVPEAPDVVDDVGDVRLGHLPVEEDRLAVREARLRATPEVEDHLDELGLVGQGVDGRHDLLRQRAEEQVEVVHRFAVAVHRCHVASLVGGHRTAGTRAGSATRTRVSFMSRVTVEIASKPLSSSVRSTGCS